MIPNRIRIGERATKRLQFLKGKTGLTPNILSRFAFVLSIRDGKKIAGTAAVDGQEFNAPTLFGEHQRLYELMLIRYYRVTKDDTPASETIAGMIEHGLHKMGHIRSIDDVLSLN